jgi:O-antigen/teichoic acid export membrane protein
MRWAWRVEGVGAAVAAGILVALALAGAEPRSGWLLIAAAAAIGVLHSVPSALLFATQRWRQAVTVVLVTGSVHTAAAVTVLAAGGGISELLAVDAAIGLVNLVWTTLLGRRELRRLPHGDAGGEDLRPVVTRFALLSTVSLGLWYVLERRSEVLFLAWFSNDAQIAIYSIPFSALAVATLVPAAIAGVTSPAFATLYGAQAVDRIRSGHARAIRLIALITFPLTAAALSIGPTVIRVVYGDEYSGTVPVALILFSALPAVAATTLSVALLTGLARIRVQIAITAGAVAVNFALNLALVPAFDAVGAATAHLAARVLAAVLLFGAALRAVSGVAVRPAALVPAAFASAGSGLVAWGLVVLVGGGPGAAAGLVAGALAFALLARALRIVPAEDAAWLQEIAAGRLGSFAARALAACSPSTPASGA